MKRWLALVMAAVLLWAIPAVAEEGQLPPMYATVGEAMADCPEDRVIAGGVPEEYVAVVTCRDGVYYRSVAYADDELKRLYGELNSLDNMAEDFFEKHDAAMAAVDEYMKTLPIAYTEAFTAQPLTAEELQALRGKTLDQLTAEGFEIGSNGTEPGEGDEPIIVYTLRFGVFDYNCRVDADFDSYEAAQENGTEGELAVAEATLAGITENAFLQRFHTDGTVDEPEDPFAEFSVVMEEVLAMLQRVTAGEEVDAEAFFNGLKDAHPEYADMVDTFAGLYRTYGAETIVTMLNPAE